MTSTTPLEKENGELRRLIEIAKNYMDESSNGATANVELMVKYRMMIDFISWFACTIVAAFIGTWLANRMFK